MTGLSFSALAKLEYGDIRLDPDKVNDIFGIFKAAGVEYSSTDDAISVRIGTKVLKKLYKRHGLSWAAEEQIEG